jgi:hypothetical protein
VSRQSDVEDLALVVADLLDHMTTVARYDWRPSRAGLGLTDERRPNGKYVQRLPRPKRNRRHVVDEDGLLVQLQRGAGRRRAVQRPDLGYGRGLGYGVDASILIGVEAPIQSPRYDHLSTRGPSPVAVLEACVDVTAAIAGTRAQMRAAAGKSRGPAQSPAANLREIRRLLLEVRDGRPLLDDAWAARALRRAKSWASTARLALAYDAPVMEIGGSQCPFCEGRLLVRGDASSDVWCAGRPGRSVEGPALVDDPWPVPDRGCGTRWPRHGWLALLAGQSKVG